MTRMAEAEIQISEHETGSSHEDGFFNVDTIEMSLKQPRGRKAFVTDPRQLPAALLLAGMTRVEQKLYPNKELNTPSHVVFHWETIVLANSDEDIAHQKSLNQHTKQMFTTAVHLANIQLNIELTKKSPGLHLDLLKLKAQEMKLKALYQMHTVAAFADQARMTGVKIPFSVAQDLREAEDIAFLRGTPLTQGQFDELLEKSLNEYQPSKKHNWKKAVQAPITPLSGIKVTKFGPAHILSRQQIVHNIDIKHQKPSLPRRAAQLGGLALALSACSVAVETGEIPTAMPQQGAETQGANIVVKTEESGLKKIGIETTLDANSYSNLDDTTENQTNAPNAVPLFDALTKALSKDSTVDLNKTTAEYVRIVHPNGAFTWELAMTQLENIPEGADKNAEYALVSYIDTNGKPVVITAMWNSSEVISDETEAATLRVLEKDGTAGQLLMAISKTENGLLIVLLDPANVDNYTTLVAETEEKFDVMKLLQAWGIVARPAQALELPSEELPSTTVAPTEKPDPLAGAPEGTTGKNGDGEWIKVNEEKGTTYVWDESAEEWVRSLGKFPAIDYFNNNLGPITIKIFESVIGEDGLSSISFNDLKFAEGAKTEHLTDSLIAELYQRIHDKKASSATQEEWLAYIDSMIKNQVKIPYVTTTGESVVSTFGTKSGFVTTIVPFESLVQEEGNGVYDFYDTQGNHYRYKTLPPDENGNVIGFIALDTERPLSELTEEQLLTLVLFHPITVIEFEEQKEKENHLLLRSIIRILLQREDFIIFDKVK
jgi:hypothetical protein